MKITIERLSRPEAAQPQPGHAGAGFQLVNSRFDAIVEHRLGGADSISAIRSELEFSVDERSPAGQEILRALELVKG